MIAVEHTTRSYSGRPGCMCGCRGTYNDGPRARKLALTALLRDPAVRWDSWSGGDEGILFVNTATRSRAVYLNADGVRAVAARGIAQEQ